VFFLIFTKRNETSFAGNHTGEVHTARFAGKNSALCIVARSYIFVISCICLLRVYSVSKKMLWQDITSNLIKKLDVKLAVQVPSYTV
jgi:hypothetical protein